MKQYLQVVKQVMNKFRTASVAQIPRGQNRHADSLATLASSITKDVPQLIKVELLVEQSIDTAVGVDVAMVSPAEWCWMDPIIDYLIEDRVPNVHHFLPCHQMGEGGGLGKNRLTVIFLPCHQLGGGGGTDQY